MNNIKVNKMWKEKKNGIAFSELKDGDWFIRTDCNYDDGSVVYCKLEKNYFIYLKDGKIDFALFVPSYSESVKRVNVDLSLDITHIID